ncbi:D-tyrosyl-tRNA(Tyr) deacylase [Ruficoccus amylovorans]|uniref:D-aminoacyl-tRNA deacylase n=1 Tax=Ruficoccus amylovorans TaxID=1804625 RepID=A0A842HGS5_9BACT|nr:D-aminoacyl-tRNA deacylase [Ruficoccus amylovorans]MBC2595208.1 D-tyrosyl-tRNA(Tyr) deacylase [Ruficoccus amylovorans]
MRAVIQRVDAASVSVAGETVGEIGPGLLVFLGVGEGDTMEDVAWLASKVCKLRVFEDGEGRMNRALTETGGGVLVISQFTLFGNLKKGTRPSFNRSAPPELAIPLYEAFISEASRLLEKPVPSGRFAADMTIHAVNNGPVTLILDTRQKDF